MNRFFPIFLVAVSLLAVFSSSSAQDFSLIRNDIEVGYGPVGVYYDSVTKVYDVMCSGFDANYNGKFEPDSGDVMPSWWVVTIDFDGQNYNYTSEKKIDFVFNSLPYFTFRPAFIPTERKIYIPEISGIYCYSLDNFQRTGETYPYYATGLGYKDGLLYIANSLQMDAQDSIIVMDTEIGLEQSIFSAGVNLLQAIPYTPINSGDFGLAALNLGEYFSDASTVMYDDFPGTESPNFFTINIGNTGNHIGTYWSNQEQLSFLYTTSMFTGAVNIIDPANDYNKVINTNSNEWTGPSFSSIIDFTDNNNTTNYLFTSTYNGTIEVRKLNISIDGDNTDIADEFIQSVETGGYKIEAFNVRNTGDNLLLLATNTFDESYSPANTLSLISLKNPNNISENEIDQVRIFPNPTHGIVKLSNIDVNEISSIQIYNLNGQVLMQLENLTTNILDLSQFSDGTYILQISSKKGFFIKKIELIK
ncbi:MAG: hypothetical protein A2X64_04640 [Ignavibacteria bacterium GWF2_33_9]|nr:MAG: hypothetical protein A2X64_04640 [Ignavibacteria bacterium GWF2_33_9]